MKHEEKSTLDKVEELFGWWLSPAHAHESHHDFHHCHPHHHQPPPRHERSVRFMGVTVKDSDQPITVHYAALDKATNLDSGATIAYTTDSPTVAALTDNGTSGGKSSVTIAPAGGLGTANITPTASDADGNTVPGAPFVFNVVGGDTATIQLVGIDNPNADALDLNPPAEATPQVPVAGTPGATVPQTPGGPEPGAPVEQPTPTATPAPAEGGGTPAATPTPIAEPTPPVEETPPAGSVPPVGEPTP